MFVNFEQKQTVITPDIICHTTGFWQEFEIGEKKVLYSSSLNDVTKDFFFLLINWKTKNFFPFPFKLVKSEAGV